MGQPQQPDIPASPLTSLQTGAIAMHELKNGYVQAGFTPQEAMQLVCAVLATSVQTHLTLKLLGGGPLG